MGGFSCRLLCCILKRNGEGDELKEKGARKSEKGVSMKHAADRRIKILYPLQIAAMYPIPLLTWIVFYWNEVGSFRLE